MKVLFIGGTGIISIACTRLAIERGLDVYLLNRGQALTPPPPGAKVIHADIHDEQQTQSALDGKTFDVVANFLNFTPAHIERDLRLFHRTIGQYLFISSASAYQKPPTFFRITESTPLVNPHWQYSRDKIACEERLMAEHRANGFPVVIIRPSLTYGDTVIPLSVAPWTKSWTIVERMLKGKPILVHGDGTNLWTTTHNTDFAKGFVGLLGDMRAVGHAFHITSDEALSWNQHYEMVGAAIGVKPKLVHVASQTLVAADPKLEGTLIGDKIYSAVFDNSKIKSFVPDFVATTPFQRGIEQTIAHFKATPALRAIDPEFDPWCDRVIAAVEKISID
jgi:nucleoside-diphosphate-sugar epimerase